MQRELLASARRLATQVVRGGLPRASRCATAGHSVRAAAPAPTCARDGEIHTWQGTGLYGCAACRRGASPSHRDEMVDAPDISGPIVQHVPHALLMTVAGWMPPGRRLRAARCRRRGDDPDRGGRARSFLSRTIPQQGAPNARPECRSGGHERDHRAASHNLSLPTRARAAACRALADDCHSNRHPLAGEQISACARLSRACSAVGSAGR